MAGILFNVAPVVRRREAAKRHPAGSALELQGELRRMSAGS